MSEFKRATEWDKMCGNVPTTQDLTDMYTQRSMDLVKEEYDDELIPYYEEGNVKEVLDAIGDSFKVLSQLAYSLQVDPEELFKEVNDSNYSKFCDTLEDAKKSVESYDDDTRYHSVYYELVGSQYVIFGYKHGEVAGEVQPKVLKGIHYREPDIQKFVK